MIQKGAQNFQRAWMMVLTGLLIVGFNLPAWGSARLESRINQLEFDLQRLRAELNQVEAQIGQATPRSPAAAPAIASRPAAVEAAEFDHLATLAVETKRDLQRLEQRVDRLERLTVTPEPN